MKTLTIILSLFCIVLFSASAFAQFDLDIGKKLEKKVNKEINKAADDAIDEGIDAVKKGAEGEPEEKDKGDKDQEDKKDPDLQTGTVQNISDDKNVTELKIWSKYDFVAGEKVIFEDNLSGEESGEFPSRWDLLSGSAEVASLGEENVIHFAHNNSIILPLMDKQDFLPDVFTLEFDVFFEKDGSFRTDIYKIRFFEGTKNSAKIDGKKIVPIDISWNEVKMGEFGGKTASFTEEKKNCQTKWKNIAVAFNKRSLKLYLDE